MTEISNHRNTFPKSEKLCSSKAIDKLFAKGESFISYPIRVVYLHEDVDSLNGEGVSVLISVSKRKFKRAVKRNRVKRLIREAYRINSSVLKGLAIQKEVRLIIAFLYLKDELPSYQEIEKLILKAINILSQKLEGEKTV